MYSNDQTNTENAINPTHCSLCFLLPCRLYKATISTEEEAGEIEENIIIIASHTYTHAIQTVDRAASTVRVSFV